MEPLLTPPAAPKGPHNLAGPLAAWLRRMGFLVTEQGGVAPTSLEAAWRGPDDTLYRVSYAFVPGEGGIFQLLGQLDARGMMHAGLVHKAQVNRQREARFLLLSNVYYAEARRAALASGALLPAHLQPVEP
ncbi:hypothetical protein [uncultured Hymenobacter sp.]|uniref:hypothetical protein n=1 Tax=uncultured Hymenobacter sp. TaxID=170016 RepID=UPI0035CC14B8